MTTKFKFATVMFAVAATAAPLAAQQTAPAAASSAAGNGWVQLFDGKDLKGWRGYKKPDAASTRWKVENGLLTIPQTGAGDTHGQQDLITDATYEQFDLRWEWKISQGGNSGVKYFILEDEPSAIGHEYQLIDDERHPDAKIGPHRQTAALYDVFPAHDRPMKPAGEWNTSEVIVKGKRVTHILNGKTVLEYRSRLARADGRGRQEQVQGHQAIRPPAGRPHPGPGSRRPGVVPQDRNKDTKVSLCRLCE